jgi:hypothetical protein
VTAGCGWHTDLCSAPFRNNAIFGRARLSAAWLVAGATGDLRAIEVMAIANRVETNVSIVDLR